MAMSKDLDTLSVYGPEGPIVVIFSEANASQRLEFYKLAATHFRAPLTEEGHVEREDFLSQQPLTRGTGWRFWCLALQKDVNCVVATCKTMHRDVLIREHGEEVQKAQGYCIATVRTDPRYQRLGLATFLLKKAAAWMDGPGNGEASMLYSDVGPDFYAKRGWKVLSAFHIRISLPNSSIPVQRADVSRTRLLRKDDLAHLCEQDIANLTASLPAPASSAKLVLVIPTHDLVSWLHARAEFISKKINNGNAPEFKGSMDEDAGVWLYWFHDFREGCLAVQRIVMISKPDVSVHQQQEALVKLFDDALLEAQKWRLLNVIIWSPPSGVQEAAQELCVRRGGKPNGVEVEMVERQHEHLPSLRWKDSNEDCKVDLLCNEYYAWA